MKIIVNIDREEIISSIKKIPGIEKREVESLIKMLDGVYRPVNLYLEDFKAMKKEIDFNIDFMNFVFGVLASFKCDVEDRSLFEQHKGNA